MLFRSSASALHERLDVKIAANSAASLLMVAAAMAVGADENRIQLKDDPEAATVRAACSVCHSADYIEMNSRFLKRAGWEAEVNKMIKVMGAPIAESDVPRIVDYLTRNYGVE
jgi:cytochrome c5